MVDWDKKQEALGQVELLELEEKTGKLLCLDLVGVFFKIRKSRA